MNSKRLFFALWPPDRQRDRLRDVIGSVARSVEGSMTYRGNWHVTLVYIGDFPEHRIADLHIAASEITVEPFRLRFDRLEFWARAKVAVLAAATVPPELERLVASLRALAVEFGSEPDELSFRPHITVATRARTFETQRLAQPADMEWSDFELIESISQPGSVSYRPLKQ